MLCYWFYLPMNQTKLKLLIKKTNHYQIFRIRLITFLLLPDTAFPGPSKVIPPGSSPYRIAIRPGAIPIRKRKFSYAMNYRLSLFLNRLEYTKIEVLRPGDMISPESCRANP